MVTFSLYRYLASSSCCSLYYRHDGIIFTLFSSLIHTHLKHLAFLLYSYQVGFDSVFFVWSCFGALSWHDGSCMILCVLTACNPQPSIVIEGMLLRFIFLFICALYLFDWEIFLCLEDLEFCTFRFSDCESLNSNKKFLCVKP